MRKTLSALLVLGLVACVSGCSKKADETKPLDQVQTESQKMNVDQLKAKVAEYKAAIEAKQPEVDKIQKELGSSLTGAVSGQKPANADELKAKLDKLQASIKALKDRMDIYAAELQKKQGA